MDGWKTIYFPFGVILAYFQFSGAKMLVSGSVTKSCFETAIFMAGQPTPPKATLPNK